MSSDLYERLRGLLDALSANLIERDTEIRLSLLAALAGEHLLLLGPPGTAKSELARRLRHALRDARYFERLLTRFSVPEELFGPLSIVALEQDRYERQTAGFLPEASIAFIDEVFKANSAILNALLTLLNEREFDNGSRRLRTPLVTVLAASNEVPEDEAIAAFHDRFLLRCDVQPIGAARFPELLALPDDIAITVPDACRFDHAELDALRRAAAAVELPAVVVELIADLRAWTLEQGIAVTDRRWRKLAQLLRIAAHAHGRGQVDLWDCALLVYGVGETAAQRATVAQWYGERLGTDRVLQPARLTRVVESFEAQLEFERTATDLNYDAAGRLALEAGAETDDNGLRSSRRKGLSGFIRPRQYGERHIGARVAQVGALLAEFDAALGGFDRIALELEETVRLHLWLPPDFAGRVREPLAATRAVFAALRARVIDVREGFAALPLAGEPGTAPAPIAVDG